MGEYRGQYEHETEGKSLEYRSEYGPPSRYFYEQKAAAERASAKEAAGRKQAGAEYRAGLERAGRDYARKRSR